MEISEEEIPSNDAAARLNNLERIMVELLIGSGKRPEDAKDIVHKGKMFKL